MFALENSWRRMCSQYTAVAVSDGDGKMPGLRSCSLVDAETTLEIKLPETITWAQIAPALPPADQTADLAEGLKRELLRNPMKALLPPTEWLQPVPRAIVKPRTH